MEEYRSILKKRMKIQIALVVTFAVVMAVSTWFCFGLAKAMKDEKRCKTM